MENSFYFRAEKITDRITRIIGITGEMMYLAIGDEKAALIDTGVGVGDLRRYVEKYTQKPVVVLLTHGHADHAMGAPAFDEIYMNPSDEKVYHEHMNLSMRKEFVKMNLGDKFASIDDKDFVLPARLDYQPLMPGDIFFLGGITLEIFDARGHTPGSVAILFKEDRLLLLGDSCNKSTFLFDAHSSSVSEYKEILKKLDRETRGKYDRVLLSHGAGEGEKEMIRGVLAVCEDIISGSADDVPFNFMGHSAYMAKKVDADYNRTDNGIGNIIYDKTKV